MRTFTLLQRLHKDNCSIKWINKMRTFLLLRFRLKKKCYKIKFSSHLDLVNSHLEEITIHYGIRDPFGSIAKKLKELTS